MLICTFLFASRVKIMRKKEVLRIQNLCVKKDNIYRLQNIYFNLYEGEVLGIIGLHDSGKTMLLRTICGWEAIVEGNIFINEEKVSPHELRHNNIIHMIQVESSLSATLSVLENVFIIRKHISRKIFIHWNMLQKQLKRCFDELNISIDVHKFVYELSPVEKHVVEIIKAYILGAKLIMIDNVMRKYTMRDYEEIYKIINLLREKGISFIITGYQMSLLQRVSDRNLFLVRGTSVKMVENIRRNQINERRILLGTNNKNELIKKVKPSEREVLFEVKDVSTSSGEKLSFQVRGGEIVVIVDLLRTLDNNLVQAILGNRDYKGDFYLEGKPIKDFSRTEKKRHIYMTDFMADEITLERMKLVDNLCLSSYRRISKCGFISFKRTKFIKNAFIRQYKEKGYNFDFDCTSMGHLEKMAIYLERIRLQRWKLLVCSNLENVLCYETYRMIEEQLENIVSGGRAILVFASSFEYFSNLADYYLLVSEGTIAGKYTYEELCSYFKI